MSAEEPRASDVARSALEAARRTAQKQQPPRRRRVAGQSRHGGYSGPGADDRDPQRLGALVGRLVDDRGWGETVAAASVAARWDAIVGAEIAARCRPESLRETELVLVAESTAWATQLRMLTPKLLARISNELGAGVVTRIRVHGPTAPTWRSGPLRVAGGRGPRDTYG